ncbi:MAG: hypothetical protein WC861_01140 [Candidatus Micrarchaeia archaeon]
MQGKLKEKGLTRVSVYLNKEELSSMAQLAEKLGYRRVGLPLETIKPHGFSGETFSNTDGISRALKYCFDFYMRVNPKLLARRAELLKEVEDLGAKI